MEIPKASRRGDPALKSAHFFPPREVALPHASGHRDRAAHTVNVKQAANVLELIEFFAAHRRPATLAEIAKHFDYSAAVLGHAAQPDEAAQFLAYITRPEARAAWKETGVENPS